MIAEGRSLFPSSETFVLHSSSARDELKRLYVIVGYVSAPRVCIDISPWVCPSIRRALLCLCGGLVRLYIHCSFVLVVFFGCRLFIIFSPSFPHISIITITTITSLTLLSLNKTEEIFLGLPLETTQQWGRPPPRVALTLSSLRLRRRFLIVMCCILKETEEKTLYLILP